MEKLRYMDRIAKELSSVDPARRHGHTDITVDEMQTTVAEFYRQSSNGIQIVDLAPDSDLMDIFNVPKRRKAGIPAQDFLREHRKMLVDKIAYWTPAQRPLIKSLVEAIEKRTGELGLYADTARHSEHLAEITVYAATLVSNYVNKGKFIQP